MKRITNKSPLVLASLLILLFYLIVYVTDYSSSEVSAKFKNDALYNEINAYNNQNKIAPMNARVDKIWRAMPGYNGLEIDKLLSYKRMEKTGEFDPRKLVYTEVAPEIHLNDLGPEPIYRGSPNKPMISFLINVAWGNEYLPLILKTLTDHNVRATFFLDGSWVSKHADLAKEIQEAGHEIGNHAYSHPDLNKRSAAETKEELSKTNDAIKAALNLRPVWFAPPSGSFNQTTVQVADQLKMKTILWTVDTVDWKNPDPFEMVERVVRKVENGSMILMHPTKSVAEGLASMITKITEQGYAFGSVSELFNESRIDPGTPETLDHGFFIK